MNESLDALGPAASENVYRVNPMDRDSGGKGQAPFDSFTNTEEEEESARKRQEQQERQERQREAERLAQVAEDRLILSGQALTSARGVQAEPAPNEAQARAAEDAAHPPHPPRLHLQA